MHLPHLIIDLGLILGAAAVITLIFKKLNQPVVLGYIVAGFLVSPYFPFLPNVADAKNISIWAEIGVIFLLFSLGLEFSFKKLLKVGKAASVTAFVEVVAMVAIGFGCGLALNWSTVDSMFLGGILAISSTTIIFRAFEDLGVKTQKFAALVFGVLVIEDLFAVLLLVFLSTLAISQNFAGAEIMGAILNLSSFLTLVFLGGIFLIPTLLQKIKRFLNDEQLLITALALCLAMVVITVKAGFSPALGAFVMGSVLAETVFVEKIEHLLSSVKHLFGAIFFVSVGMLLNPAVLVQYFIPILLITLITLFGKLISTALGAVLAGQPLKSSFKAGMSLAQIGEFSFIIATLGLTLNVTSSFLYPIAVAVSAITTFTTPYCIRYSDKLYPYLEKCFPQSFIQRLNQYAANTEATDQQFKSSWSLVLRSYLNILIATLLPITALMLIFTKILHPWFEKHIYYPVNAGLSLTVISCLIAPFMWNLVFKKIHKQAYSHLWISSSSNRVFLVLLEISRVCLALCFIGFLLHYLFSALIAMCVGFVVIIGAWAIFSKNIRHLSKRLEKRFLTNLNAKQAHPDSPKLLPWDTHLTSFKIAPESTFIGKTLQELALRERFGITIAVIDRGSIKIALPSPNEQLYPFDKISVVGTDEQLTVFGHYLETERLQPTDSSLNVELKQIHIAPKSALIGKTIQESGIREKYQAMVVGIERNMTRILNPKSNMAFEEGDLVWIVGKEG